MRIAIETLGTRGDVQPYLALGLALLAAGHEVQLAGPEQYGALADGVGVSYVPLPGEFLALLDTPEGKAAIASGGGGFGAGLKLIRHVKPMMRRLLDAEWAAVAGFAPEIVVYHPKSLAAPHMAEKLGVPAILASPLPGFTATAAFPSPLLPFRSLGPLNRASHLLATRGPDVLFGKMLRAWRDEALGLGRRRGRIVPAATLYAYSRHLLPVPADWGKGVSVTGAWFLDEPQWTMPPELAAFLAAGDKPVYVGFGSMPGIEADRLAADVLAALKATGKRGVLATGGGALGAMEASPEVHVIAGAPHDRLLPHMSAALHHGGAGTTHASLRAGLPTMICPFFGDQPFWARRVAELAVGPAPLSRKTLTAEALAAAFRATEDPHMQARAAALGDRIRSEPGVAAAREAIEAVALRGAASRP